MIEVYTDGASSGHPGVSGIGIYIKNADTSESYSIPIGKCTNHEAEFYAVIEALHICKEQYPNEILSFRSDSKIVVDSIEKDYVKKKTFQPLLQQIQQEGRSFPYFFIKWIPSKENKHADQLARKAIHMQLQ